MSSSASPAVVTRFAPSPTGRLHLGHAYAALFAYRAAKQAGGRFLVRIEDIDGTRCSPAHERAMLDDLAWLGLEWDPAVRRQSEHLADYAAAIERLKTLGVVYPCFCTRSDIRAEILRSGAAPQGPDGPHYPGICRRSSANERRQLTRQGKSFGWRLDVTRAAAITGNLDWIDLGLGRVTANVHAFGDVVVARKETPTSYHLAVTVDDHLQGVSLVTRGDDLIPSTHIHRLLQALLGYDPPVYHHHPLIRDAEGKRLAKRDDSPTIAGLRGAGHTPEEVRAIVEM